MTARSVLSAAAVTTAMLALTPTVDAQESTRSAPPPVTASAASSDAERLAIYDEALVSLTQELSYLVLLGWVRAPVPVEAQRMPPAIGIERMASSDMIDAVRYLDEQRGPGALAQLRELGVPITRPIEVVLGTNVPIVAGELPQVGVGVYLEAYEQLLEPWQTLVDAVDPAMSQPLTSVVPDVPTGDLATAPAMTVPTTTPSTAQRANGTDAGWLTLGAVISIASVLALIAVGVVTARRVRGRRSAGPRSPEQAMSDDLLEAGRTIMAAADLDAFGNVVAEQTRRLARSDGAVVIDGGAWNPTGRSMPASDAVGRAIATGRVVHAEGAALVPVVADGHVVGALIAWTDAAHDIEVLGVFAPLVGASLQGLRSRIEHEHLAYGDALTGLGNRRRFDRDLDRLVGVDSGRGTQVALAMVDVDHFKQFNDTHGHPIGDVALRHVADVIAAHVREGDLVYRYGGEEFAILLPGTSLDDARAVVDRICSAVASSPVRLEATDLPALTVSVGLSGTPPVDGSAMLRTADGALYAAKSNGRNRVEVSLAR